MSADTLQTRDHRHRPEDRMLAIPGDIAAEMVTTSHIDIAAVTIMNHFTFEIWRLRYMSHVLGTSDSIMPRTK